MATRKQAEEGGTVTVEDVTEDDDRIRLVYNADGLPVNEETGEVLYDPNDHEPMGEMRSTLLFLSQEFDSSLVQKKGKFDYISHALVTERLNRVCPGWSMEIVQTHTSTDSHGRLHCEGVTVAMTINGVTRVEMGGPQRQESFMLECKNAVSDAMKRAAMRFGVALYLWDNLVDSLGDDDVHPDREPQAAPAPARATQQPQAASNGATTDRTQQRGAQEQQQYPYAKVFQPAETTTTVIRYMNEKGIEVTGYQGKPPNMGSAIFAANRWGKANGFGDEIVVPTGEWDAQRGKQNTRPCDIGNAISHWARIKMEREKTQSWGDEDETEDVPF
jgi:hypothetical protein